MSKAKKFLQLTLLSLSMLSYTPISASDPSRLQFMARAIRMGMAAAKKICWTGASFAGAYLLTGYLLGYCQNRSVIASYSEVGPLRHLKIYTEGTVEVKPCPIQDQAATVKITHIYGANEQSAMSQIAFKDGYDHANQTLTVEGLLGSYKPSFFEMLIARIFRIQRRWNLHHIIEIPTNTPNIEITIGKSDCYVPEGKPTVLVDNILAHLVKIVAYQGNVTTTNKFENAQLSASAARHSVYAPTWKLSSPNAVQPDDQYNIEIHASENAHVKALNIPGKLIVWGPPKTLSEVATDTKNAPGCLDYTHHSQNQKAAQVFLNGHEKGYVKPRSLTRP